MSYAGPLSIFNNQEVEMASGIKNLGPQVATVFATVALGSVGGVAVASLWKTHAERCELGKMFSSDEAKQLRWRHAVQSRDPAKIEELLKKGEADPRESLAVLKGDWDVSAYELAIGRADTPMMARFAALGYSPCGAPKSDLSRTTPVQYALDLGLKEDAAFLQERC